MIPIRIAELNSAEICVLVVISIELYSLLAYGGLCAIQASVEMKPQRAGKQLNAANRVVAWISVAFGACVTASGVLISMSGGGQDAGGILGGVFIFGGLFLIILAFPEPISK